VELPRIGRVAKATGISVRAIRHHDQLGLLTSIRAENGYRGFQTQDIERVRLIQLFLGIGFTLDEIKRWAPCFAGGLLPDEVSQQNMAAFYSRKVARLDSQIMALQQLRDRLTLEVCRFPPQPDLSDR